MLQILTNVLIALVKTEELVLTRLEATTASANVVTMVKTAILVCDFVFCVITFLAFIVRFSILKIR